MAFLAPFIKQEPREEEDSCFTSSPIIQHEVSYATVDTSIGSYEGRIFICPQPPSIVEHGLESLASAIRKRSHDFPNLRWEEEIPSPEPEDENHPSYSTYAEASQSQALHSGSASFNTTIRTIVEDHFNDTSVPASNQDHCGSTPDFGDDYIPFDNTAQSEKDEDSGLFEASPRTVSQHAKAHGISFSTSPANQAVFRSASIGDTFSATEGLDQSVANDRQSYAEWNGVPSHGHNFVKVEELSSFDDADFGGEHNAAYHDHQAQNVGPEYNQENIDPNAEVFSVGYEPEPSRATMFASTASRKRSLSQYADEYILEVEASSGVRQKLNELFESPRNSFHASWFLSSSPPRLRNNSVSRPFLGAIRTSARSRRSEDEDTERRQTAYSITTG
ncbi:hypothetical protein E6O75_ATG05259 [Venturia nashicola]|uniref:Uncharacterized protein n=1 Tax=Venturia nashicola TaxID=86259 RepID=A0A4Z1NYV6_9PEZI|nr:hypothetical protein E6O75_ATG05259 [Venturia nashicola]